MDSENRRLLADDIDSVRIQLASADDIRGWSAGEVRKALTVDARTGRPVPHGLFCQRIFGPELDYTCACSRGGLSGKEHAGRECPKCQVRIESSDRRRWSMGHIELAASVVHIWGVRVSPFRLASLLDLPARLVERIVYYQAYLVEAPGETGITPGAVLDDQEYFEARAEHGHTFSVHTGAEAIRLLLSRLDLPAEARRLRKMLAEAPAHQGGATRRRAAMVRRLETIESLLASEVDPLRLVLDCLPVTPPALRPMLNLPGAAGRPRMAAHDLNAHYIQVLRVNERLVRLKQLDAPAVMLRAEQRRLQDAVDGLFDNELSLGVVRDASQRPLQSLGYLVKGKAGRFRKNLLGKRVDYSGRAVIVAGPELKLGECGLPKKIALELFRPMLLGRLQRWRREQRESTEDASELLHPMVWSLRKLAAPDALVWDLLSELAAEHRVLLNRAPTLHRLNVQSFRPLLVDGNAIHLHPLVCAGFNADFDGDTMAVHLPLSRQAIAEAERLCPTNNLFSPADGRLVASPSQDAVLGCYYLTAMLTRTNDAKRQPSFANSDQVIVAHADGRLCTHDTIVLRLPAEREIVSESGANDDSKPHGAWRRVATTVGRVMLNAALPDSLPYYNVTCTSAALGRLLADAEARLGRSELAALIDAIKTLGFRWATRSGMTFALDDLLEPSNKSEVIAAAEAEDARVRKESADREHGRERRVALWRGVQEAVSQRLVEQLQNDTRNGVGYLNPVYAMAASGARSKWVQVRQLAAMRGLMARASGPHDTHDRPILSSLREGLSTWEFFLSVYGARKAGADKVNLPESGYLTRKLVDAAHQAVVAHRDCGDTEGIVVDLSNRDGAIVGRVTLDEVRDTAGQVVLAAQELITAELAATLAKLGIKRLRVRSPLTCQALPRLCQRCYGADLSTGRLVERGLAVGVIAAQSVGEPGVQLAMNTKHTGGVAERQNGLKIVLKIFESPAAFIGPGVENQQIALVELLAGIYRDSGIGVDAKHFEVLVAQLARRMVIVDAGDTGFYQGEVVDRERLAYVNAKIDEYVKIAREQPGRFVGGQVVSRRTHEAERERGTDVQAVALAPAIAKPKLQGVGAAALASDSFLSAASFERANRVLIDAALGGRVDRLRGLKENVMLGRLIPAGGGFSSSNEDKRVDSASSPSASNLLNLNQTAAAVSTTKDRKKVPSREPISPARARQERRAELPYRQMTDEQLLASYYDQNDHIAFEELDLRYRAMLSQSAFFKLGRMAGRRQIADDLASETLVKVVETRGKRSAWDRARAVKPWLFTILHNNISSFVRLKHNQTLSLSDLDRPASDGEEISLADILPGESPSVEEQLLADALDAEFAGALPAVASQFSGSARMVVLNVFAAHLGERGRAALECLEDLSAAERAVVVDGLGHKLDQQTIAHMHGVSPAQVSKVLSRARADMTRRLAERGFAAATK